MNRGDAVHPTPAWRERADFIIGATLPEPGRSEQLWARRLSERRFELRCIPFFAYDLALGDVVETNDDYTVRQVLEPSGRYVFRVWVAAAPERLEPICARLEAVGCLLERSSEHLVGVDARDQAVAPEVADLLAEQESQSGVRYETGRTS